MSIKILGTRMGVVSRQKGQSVLQKSVYGHSGYILNKNRAVISTSIKDIIFHKVYLPKHADRKMSDPHTLWSSAQKAERRKDAALARTLDVTLPRQLSAESWIAIAEQIALRFAKCGVPLQADVHCPLANDGFSNPHIHFLIAERTLHADGFDAKKNSDLIKIFRTGYGRPLRNKIADIINDVAFSNGHSHPIVTSEKRPTDYIREPRLPRFVVKQPNSPSAKAMLYRLHMLRSQKSFPKLEDESVNQTSFAEVPEQKIKNDEKLNQFVSADIKIDADVSLSKKQSEIDTLSVTLLRSEILGDAYHEEIYDDQADPPDPESEGVDCDDHDDPQDEPNLEADPFDQDDYEADEPDYDDDSDEPDYNC